MAVSQPKDNYSVAQLNEKLGYGRDACSDDQTRKNKLKSIDNFLKTFAKGSRFIKPRGRNDLNRSLYQESMSRMAKEYLDEEGSEMWPSNSKEKLYQEKLVWPRDGEKLEKLMTMMFFTKCMNQHKNGKQSKRRQLHSRANGTASSAMEIDDEAQGQPQNCSSLQRSPDTRNGRNQTGTCASTSAVEEDDPFEFDSGGDMTTNDIRSPRTQEETLQVPSRTEGRLSTRPVSAERSTASDNTRLGTSSSSPRAAGRSDASRKFAERVRPEGRTAGPSSGNSSIAGIDLSDDEDLPSVAELLTPSRNQIRDKGKERERDTEMPPPAPPSGALIPPLSLEPIQSDRPFGAEHEAMDMFSGMGNRAPSVWSVRTFGRSPSLRPGAPEAVMGYDEAQTSVETDPSANEPVSHSRSTARLPLEPEIWYHTIKSRKPKWTKSWKPNGRFSEKTLVELKKEMDLDFDNDSFTRLRCVLKGSNGMRAEIEIDHNDEHHLQRLKRLFESNIRESMLENGSGTKSPVIFDIEVELVEGEQAAVAPREESVAPLVW